MRIECLENRRGKRIGLLLPSRTSEEIRDKIAKLKRKNLNLQIGNDLL
mgnify:FL=1